jgi:hypothetical protein
LSKLLNLSKLPVSSCVKWKNNENCLMRLF